MIGLPKGWVATTLGDVIELRYGKSLPEKDRVSGDFGVYGSNGVVGSHTAAVTEAPAIVVGRKGSIGEVHFSETACFPIDTTYFVDRFDCSDPRFALHLLRHLPLREMSRASAIPGLNREDAYSLPIGLPPLPEQRRIVAKIDSLSGKSRRGRDHLDHIPRLVENYKQAVLAAAFTEVSRASGNISTLGEVAIEVRNGLSKKPTDGPEGTPILRISAVRPRQVRLEDIRYYPADEVPSSALLRSGDLLFTRYNGNPEFTAVCGQVRDVQGALTYPDKLIRVRVASEVNPSFVELMATSEQSRRWFDPHIKSAAGQHGISGADLKRLPLPLPSLSTQLAVVERVQTALAWIDQLAAQTTTARKLIDRLDQAVLAKAFRGELVPQDPDDEPAGVLLERIRAERSQASRTGRGRRKAAAS